ncbi:MAG: hypothetical protein ACUVRA_02020 [Candidatus Bathyarchaeaceae archaeon]
MIRWFKRKISSLAFFLQKTYWKIITAKPSIFVIAVIVVAACIFLLGGGVYDILEKPLVAVVATGGSIIVYYPYSLNEQFLMESIVVMVGYVIGVAGFLLTYQSTKYAYRPRQAYIMLLVGCILIITAYIFVERSLLARWG